jgi:hypothetical protein
MTRRHPSDSALGVGDDIGKPLARDGDESHRLVRGVRDVVQPRLPLGEIDDVSGCTSGVPARTKNISSTP